MADKTLDFEDVFTNAHKLATDISDKWQSWNSARQQWRTDRRELRNYLFATDTTTTSNKKQPWKNSTTIPKLCQIRDNLYANYISALFPNDSWMKWEGYTADDDIKEKAKNIESYMANKARESNLRTTIGELLYDYIDGNVFATVEFVNESHNDPETGEIIPGYIGPKVVRVSPLDICFDITASEFKNTPIITRTIKSLGHLENEAESKPEMLYNKEVLANVRNIRVQQASIENTDKEEGFFMDGFGSMHDYFASGYVELLEFQGDIYDSQTGELKRNRIITVVDRAYVVRDIPNPSWFGVHNIKHVGWRKRPDNLYSMGPLDNLVGMQYRLDHLENLKADALDFSIHAPISVRGAVNEFEWRPGAVINMEDDGNVEVMHINPAALAANSEMQYIMSVMEEMAGAPKQAMGIRTPGEKTAFEVQSLQNAAGRIFQEKITNFEVNLLEPLLNMMLEVARRNMDAPDLVRVMDDDFGVADFIEITKADITAKGKIRPIGARHFAAQAQLIQNYAQWKNTTGNDPAVMAHVSGKAEAKMAEEVLGLAKYTLVSDNVRLFEQLETQQLMAQAEQQQMDQDSIALEGDIDGPAIAPAPPVG